MSARNLVLATLVVLGGFAAASSAWSQIAGIPREGGFVKPCSLDGVNPVHHPEIFGNPAAALREYGFVRAKNGTWHVIPNCNVR